MASQEFERYVVAFALKNAVGSGRALVKMCRALGAGAASQRLKISEPLACWVYLRPRQSVAIETDDRSLSQNCITANYFLAGSLPGGIKRGDGLWSIEFSDHALGRLIQRGGTDIVAAMLEAHHSILRARVDDLRACFSDGVSFRLPAGPGVFVCTMSARRDIGIREISAHALARTWIHADMLHDNQHPIAVDAVAGEERIGDSFLLPAPLRKITCEGEKMAVSVWA
jgi:hypothetical protein